MNEKAHGREKREGKLIETIYTLALGALGLGLVLWGFRVSHASGGIKFPGALLLASGLTLMLLMLYLTYRQDRARRDRRAAVASVVFILFSSVCGVLLTRLLLRR